jgi:hypothetical protein
MDANIDNEEDQSAAKRKLNKNSNEQLLMMHG